MELQLSTLVMDLVVNHHDKLLLLLNCYILNCDILSCYILNCYILNCYILNCYILTCHILNCYTLNCYTLKCYIFNCYILNCYILNCYKHTDCLVFSHFQKLLLVFHHLISLWTDVHCSQMHLQNPLPSRSYIIRVSNSKCEFFKELFCLIHTPIRYE